MTVKTFKLLVMLILALFLANSVSAKLDDLNLLHQPADTQDSMVWPVLPNESIGQLAARFYPNNKIMQRKFIQKTKRLNKGKLNANAKYKKLTAITIPNLESLSAQAGVIKRAKNKSGDKPLRLSYGIEAEAEEKAFTLSSIPERLVNQYKNLLERNTFLKTEIKKLNQRLVFLESKLGQLKLIFDKSLTLPQQPKKKLKNLNAKKVPAKPLQIESQNKPTMSSSPTDNIIQENSFLDVSNKWLWVGLFLFGLLVVLASTLISKFRERKYTRLVNAVSQQNPVTSFNPIEAGTTSKEDALFQSSSLNKDTVVEEPSDKSVLQEAKALTAQGLPEEAGEHLKWAIRANPKTAIGTWLYLLEILRLQNLKDDYEKFALEMHQNFNVMTPPWVQREVQMVVPQSLEEFPNIIKLLTDKWPNEKIAHYLNKLVLDNRSGERVGFSPAVIEEILLLSDVLAVREPDEDVVEND